METILLRVLSKWEFHKGCAGTSSLQYFHKLSLVKYFIGWCCLWLVCRSLTAAGKSIAAINSKLQTSLQEVSDWCSANAMLLNPWKTKSMVITTRQKHQRDLLSLDHLLKTQVIEQVTERRHLGVIINYQLKRQAHVNCLTDTVAKNVYLLSRLRYFSNSEACGTFFHAHIMSKTVIRSVCLCVCVCMRECVRVSVWFLLFKSLGDDIPILRVISSSDLEWNSVGFYSDVRKRLNWKLCFFGCVSCHYKKATTFRNGDALRTCFKQYVSNFARLLPISTSPTSAI